MVQLIHVIKVTQVVQVVWVVQVVRVVRIVRVVRVVQVVQVIQVVKVVSLDDMHSESIWFRRFRQAKHGQNGPTATVCQQGICCPICEHHFTHWTHPDISLPFRAGGRRLKNFRFSRICMSAREFFLSACCGLNFDATDLPNS